MFANHEHNRNDMIIYKLLTYNICINHYSYTNMTNVLIFKWLWASHAGDPNGIIPFIPRCVVSAGKHCKRVH